MRFSVRQIQARYVLHGTHTRTNDTINFFGRDGSVTINNAQAMVVFIETTPASQVHRDYFFSRSGASALCKVLAVVGSLTAVQPARVQFCF